MVELRNPYIFGDEEISLSEFSELFKDTFEIIKTAKNDFIYKGIFNWIMIPQRYNDTWLFNDTPVK